MELEDRIQRQTIVADMIMYQAILTFINLDLTSYVKGACVCAYVCVQTPRIDLRSYAKGVCVCLGCVREWECMRAVVNINVNLTNYTKGT